VLFEDGYDTFANTSCDVSPDDRHFVMIEMDRDARRLTHFNVVLNWFQELERLTPSE